MLSLRSFRADPELAGLVLNPADPAKLQTAANIAAQAAAEGGAAAAYSAAAAAEEAGVGAVVVERDGLWWAEGKIG